MQNISLFSSYRIIFPFLVCFASWHGINLPVSECYQEGEYNCWHVWDLNPQIHARKLDVLTTIYNLPQHLYLFKPCVHRESTLCCEYIGGIVFLARELQLAVFFLMVYFVYATRSKNKECHCVKVYSILGYY